MKLTKEEFVKLSADYLKKKQAAKVKKDKIDYIGYIMSKHYKILKRCQ
jgi:hypothetical protein